MALIACRDGQQSAHGGKHACQCLHPEVGKTHAKWQAGLVRGGSSRPVHTGDKLIAVCLHAARAAHEPMMILPSRLVVAAQGVWTRTWDSPLDSPCELPCAGGGPFRLPPLS